MTLIHHLMMSLQPNDTKFKIYCHYAQVEGSYQSVTCNKGRRSQGEGGLWWVFLSKKGWGAVMSHPRRGGGPWWVTQRGVGDRDESSKRGVSQKRRGRLHQSQPRGGVGGQIMLMWGQSVNPSTDVQVIFSRFYWNSKWPPRINFNFLVGAKTKKIMVNCFLMLASHSYNMGMCKWFFKDATKI